MHVRASLALATLVATLLATPATPASAQSGTLDRRLTADFVSAPLAEVLTVLRRVHDVPIAWSGDVLPPEFRVTVGAQDTPLRNFLAAALSGSGLTVVETRGGTIVVVPSRYEPGPPAAADTVATEREVERGLMATGIQQLDRVIVMGSAVGADPEREQPTAIGIVGTARLQQLPTPSASRSPSCSPT